ncbi:hypothetical protein D0962_04330 [Leptolyngbyaceae cyanobacterium CCMR0082]|uniref:Uncharacterized protein n=1 Tax=Adonisia turfae CCMR0082 TaxID=2304604 RepID=A0A6M0S0M5_9CYAN|nr:hypothetical protein [Adonisia turfae]NEZ62008.1 hypothetical protein [Adonisia turfae CCMR0082]
MLITIADQYCWLGKSAVCDIEELDILLRELETKWMVNGFNTGAMLEKPYVQLVSRVLQVLPQRPQLEIQISKLAEDLISFEHLFFRTESGQSLIAQHHQFEPKLKRLTVKKGEAITPQHLPFPTSGNAADDQLASILTSFHHPALATWVWQSLSPDQIDRVLYCLKELNIPEEDRLAAYIAELALERQPDLMNINEAEKAFDDIEHFINTGELKNGWQSSRVN